MRSIYAWLKKLSSAKQFFLARTVYDWSIFVFDTFYMTTIFKESGEIRDVVLNIIITLLTIYAGYVLGAIFLKRLGVEANLKLSYALYLLTGFIGIYLSQAGLVSFFLISIFRGLSEGFFWVSSNFVELVGVPKDSRGKIYSISNASYGIFSLIAPVSLGYLLTTFNTFLPIYALFSLFWFIGLLLPFDFKINHQISFSFAKFKNLFKQPKIGQYTLLKFLQSTMWMLDWFNFAVIPFVLLGNEFNMGVLLTISALINIAISYFTRNLHIKNKATWGGYLILVSSAFSALFAFNFTVFFLYLSNIVATLTGSISMPAEFDLSVRATNIIENDEGMGNEVNLYQESVYTVARVILAAVLLFLGTLFDNATLLPALIIVWVILRIVVYVLNFWLVKPHRAIHS